MSTFALVAGYVWCGVTLLLVLLVIAALVWQSWRDWRDPHRATVTPLYPQSSHVRVVGKDGAA